MCSKFLRKKNQLNFLCGFNENKISENVSCEFLKKNYPEKKIQKKICFKSEIWLKKFEKNFLSIFHEEFFFVIFY